MLQAAGLAGSSVAGFGFMQHCKELHCYLKVPPVQTLSATKHVLQHHRWYHPCKAAPEAACNTKQPAACIIVMLT
jgi:hypothetical protein